LLGWTVYGLWKVPNILPAFMLKGAEVSRYVLGGADLMFPGIDVHGQDLPMFAAGEPWSILVPGNPFPIAVSILLIPYVGLADFAHFGPCSGCEV